MNTNVNTNIKKILFGNSRQKRPPALLAVTPPRTGERTLLGVENLLQSIAVPEPFSLELAGDMDGVTRCQDDQVVRGQLAPNTCPCAPSGTTICWTPAPTPSSP